MSKALSRFGVLGDIHAEDVRLDAALAFLEMQRVDAVLSVGDIVDGPGDPERCVTLLRRGDVVTVRGNHDRWIAGKDLLSDAERRRIGWTTKDDLSADSLAWLSALPATRALECTRGSLLLCHGIGDDDMTRFSPPGPDDDVNELARRHAVVVAGHVHERFVHRVGRCTIVNAGTLSTRGVPGFALVDLVEGMARWFDVDDDGSIRAAEALPV